VTRADPAGQSPPPRRPRRTSRPASAVERGRRGTTISILNTNETTPGSPDPAAAGIPTFAELGVLPETVEALDALGITSPFPIQTATIPVALGGSDVIGQAKTGTGKTLAFGIPVLQRVSGPGADPQRADAELAAETEAEQAAAPAGKSGARRRGRGRGAAPATGTGTPAHGAPQALVVVPTRELAVQVANDLTDAGKVRAVRVHALYGGRSYEPQVAALRAGIDVAVGTPGRLLDLARQNHLDLSRVRTLVLDEADEMLDLGFLPDVERIVSQLPAERQTLLFSATMPGQVISLARRYMVKPTHIRASDPYDEGLTVANIANFVYRAHSMDKVEMLARILQADGRGLSMVFARTKRTVAKIADELTDRHFAVAAVHGDLGQGAREQALRAFRNGKVDVLVATDVAARGIDVDGVTHVVNFQCPEDEKVYTHRTGRTGRAGAKGIAVTFVDWDEVPRWQLINKALGLGIPDPAELYSTSPQLYSDLNIPEGAKGVLPKLGRVREGLAAEEVEDLGETGRTRATPRAAAPVKERTERPERSPRQRRRTRGGEAAEQDGAVVAPDAAPASAPQDVPATAETAADPAATGRKRVRNRRPTAQTALQAAAQAVPQTPVESAPTAPATPPALDVEAPASTAGTAKRQRPPVTSPVFSEAGAIAAETAEKAARARTRTRRSAGSGEPASIDSAVADTSSIEPTAPPAGQTAPAGPDQAADKPERKRTRTRKSAAPAEATGSAADAAAPAEAAAADAPAPAPARARRTAKQAPAAQGGPTARATRTRVGVASGGSIRLSHGSLADPLPETAQPAAPAQPEPEPLTRTPRKRAAKKAADVSAEAAGDEGAAPGPVANPRRTQLSPARPRKSAAKPPADPES
jgi:superfamily II DNA/RNA helicase